MKKFSVSPIAGLALLAFAVTLPAQNAIVTYQGRISDNGTNFDGTGLFKFALVASPASSTSSQATATAVLTGPFVTSYTVTYGGSGYTSAPGVTVTGGGGDGASAQAMIGGGAVTNLIPINAGSGYTSAPTVTIAPPASGSLTTFWSNDGTSVNGSEPSSAVTINVVNGLFTVGLGDTTVSGMAAIPASTFAQPNLSLQIWFNDGANGSIALNPSQTLTQVPYAAAAATASNLSGTISAAQLTGALGNGQLASNSITFNAGPGLSGGGGVFLGGSISLTNAGVTSLAGNGDITVSGSSGAVSLGSTATSTNVAGSIVKRDASGSFSITSITINGTLAFSSPPVSETANGNSLLRADALNNLFHGLGAGNASLTGGRNTGVGGNALRALGGGNANTASGFDALYNVTGGSNNLASGVNALYNNVNGSQNTAEGFNALYTNLNGNNNTASGANALYLNSGGFQNTAAGYDALYNNSSGSNNTAVGALALAACSTGTNNISLGFQAGYNVSTGNNTIEIGNPGLVTDGNLIRIGAQGTHTNTFVAGIFGTTVTGGTAVYVTASGQLGVLSSSSQFKQDVRDMQDESDVLLSLRPVAFRYKPEIDPKGAPQFGLLAEEVAKIDPALVVRDDQNQIYTVRYEAVNAMLLNEFLKEHRTVVQQADTLRELVQKVEVQNSENADLKKRVELLEKSLERPTAK